MLVLVDARESMYLIDIRSFPVPVVNINISVQ